MNGDRRISAKEMQRWIVEKTAEHFQEAVEESKAHFHAVDPDGDGTPSPGPALLGLGDQDGDRESPKGPGVLPEATSQLALLSGGAGRLGASASTVRAWDFVDSEQQGRSERETLM